MRRKKHLGSVFVIYDTQEEKLWNSNGSKIGWVNSGAAKNAWNLCSTSGYDDNGWPLGKLKFDEQQRYIIVEISETIVKSLVKEKSID